MILSIEVYGKESGELMKVLSLKEPYASCILASKKKIETRSWKTSYRGELYIHASASSFDSSQEKNRQMLDLLGDSPLHYGMILCKCQLVDCILMSEEYVQEMKKNHLQEYLCGIYEVGRYAWILDKIEPLPSFLPAKGQLLLWDYYPVQDILPLMENIEYGWVNLSHEKMYHLDDTFSLEYRLLSPKEVLSYRIGVCWDQVELERYYLRGNCLPIQTYFLVYYDESQCPTHTFLTFQKEGKYYWMEHAWEKFRGLRSYDTLKDLLTDVRNCFIDVQLHQVFEPQNLCLFAYKKPSYGITVLEFYHHCEKGEKIDLDSM